MNALSTEPDGVDRKRTTAFDCYAQLVDKPAHSIEPSTDRTAAPSLEELAAQQGVTPIDDFEALFGDPSRDDEPSEEFSASLREWRLGR